MILGAVIQVTPVTLAMWGLDRRDFFAVELTFPLTSIEGRLIGAISWMRLYSTS